MPFPTLPIRHSSRCWPYRRTPAGPATLSPTGRLHSLGELGEAGPEAGSLGYEQLRKIPSVPSAASATSLHSDPPVTFAPTTLLRFSRPLPDAAGLCHDR